MFTGIVEAVGRVSTLRESRLEILATLPDVPVRIGESISVNGCCLTAVASGPSISFDLSQETLVRTTLGQLSIGDPVNLERAMRADGRFGGHIVQGHVDGTGEILEIAAGSSGSYVFRYEAPPDAAKFLIDKGSISVDGVSLTVVRPDGAHFEAWVIPHTFAATNLGRRKAGDRVNLEYDVLAKYVSRLLSPSLSAC